MRPFQPTTEEEFGEEEEGAGRGSSRPELFHRRAISRRVKSRARRSRSNDVAKRGMHQRRNKRLSW